MRVPCVGARSRLDRRDGERALAVRTPDEGLGGAGAPRNRLDAVRHHESRIKADAELADEIDVGAGATGVLRRVFLRQFLRLIVRSRLRADPVEKGAGSGAGDGAKRIGQLLARHADAIILDGERSRVLVEADRYLEGRRRERRVGQRLIAQLLAGVGGVRQKFAQKNIAVGIDRMHHEMEQPRDICLKGLRLTGGF